MVFKEPPPKSKPSEMKDTVLISLAYLYSLEDLRAMDSHIIYIFLDTTHHIVLTIPD
jgi:hypothetical protein